MLLINNSFVCMKLNMSNVLGMYVYHNGMEGGWAKSIAEPANFAPRVPNNGEWSYYSTNSMSLISFMIDYYYISQAVMYS